MAAFVFSDLLNIDFWLAKPWLALLQLFSLWMVIEAIRRDDWIWAIFILFSFGATAVIYFFLVYRAAPSATRGFELPGAHDRRRIKQLEAQIHNLDKAHHHSQLGDIYFQQGKLPKAETCYRAAMERDAEDLDTRSHLGQCLLRQKKPAEARPLLESVVTAKPDHDYGYTMMALAEVHTALGETDAAIALWRRVTENHTYPRAKVQLAEAYLATNQPELARAEAKVVLEDEAHMPGFQRRRDRIWLRRGKALMRKLGPNS